MTYYSDGRESVPDCVKNLLVCGCRGESDSFALALQKLASIRAFLGVLKHGFSFHDDSLWGATAF